MLARTEPFAFVSRIRMAVLEAALQISNVVAEQSVHRGHHVMTMHSKDRLAKALEEVDLRHMAYLAREGYYHDFMSPLDAPCIQLVNDLWQAAENHPEMRGRILSLRLRAMDGEFDATKEEADDWAASKEGQEAFKRLKGK
jgi:hypothetical protein